MMLASVVEFQKRRRATWRAIRWWLAAALCFLSLLILVVSMSIDDNELKAGVALSSGTIISLTVAGLIIRRMYRCPICNKVPMRTVPGWKDEFGAEPHDIAWDPGECPNCGVRLR